MADVDRSAVIEHALRRLAEPSFRDKLTAMAPDGTKPVFAALLNDRAIDVIREVHDHGGTGNVIIPLGNSGFFVVALSVSHDAALWGYPTLSPSITMGVLIARAIEDGVPNCEVSYNLPDGCLDGNEVASTRFVGVAE